MRRLTYISLFFVCLLFASCQKITIEDEPDVPQGKVMARFKVGIYDMVPFDKVNTAKTRS